MSNTMLISIMPLVIMRVIAEQFKRKATENT